MKRVILLGSTGSIGNNTVEVIKTLKNFKIVGIATHTNHQSLLGQAAKLKPEAVAIINDKHYKNLKQSLKQTKVFCGEHGILELIQSLEAEILVAAFSSSVGIRGILKAIEKKMRICLATKEILVSFGDVVMRQVKRYGSTIIPIDSEHSAIYQCLEGRRKSDVMNIILTATGGPFLHRPIHNVNRKEVLKHPVWKMGKKITVDSATMMNKGLEVIEAHYLFDLPPEKIKIVIHPEALCHSLVQFVDGGILCQLSTPDMRLPIQYALTAPDRLPSKITYLDIKNIDTIHFSAPNNKKFPCLKLAYKALTIGKSMPTVLNGANAEAVKLFLEDRIKFDEIPAFIAKTMNQHKPCSGTIDNYIEAEKWAREYVQSMARKI